MAIDWLIIFSMVVIIFLVDILIIAAVIKICRALECCESPHAVNYHSVEGNTMESKNDMNLVP
jgi:hypothetical protein